MRQIAPEFSEPIATALAAVPVPAEMVQVRRGTTSVTLASYSLAALTVGGIVTRVGATYSSMHRAGAPVLNDIIYSTAQNVLGATQMLALTTPTAAGQLLELGGGVAIITGVALGGGKILDTIQTNRKLATETASIRQAVTESGHHSHPIQIGQHVVLVSPKGLPSINRVGDILGNTVLVTTTYRPYEETNRRDSKVAFPLYIATAAIHDEDTYKIASTERARAVIVVPQSQDKLVFFDSTESTRQALEACCSALTSVPEGRTVPTLVFLQSPADRITSADLTAVEFLETRRISEDKVQFEYLENIVVDMVSTHVSENKTMFLATDLTGTNLKKLEAMLESKGITLVSDIVQAKSILVYFQEDMNNQTETKTYAGLHPDKQVISIVDTQTEVSEVKSSGATAICIEDIICEKVAEFNRQHQPTEVARAIRFTKAEQRTADLHQALAVHILRRSPAETKKILTMLEYAEVHGHGKGYRFTKRRHFQKYTNVLGTEFPISFGRSPYKMLHSATKEGLVHTQTAIDVAKKYFKTDLPTQEQVISIQTVLKAGACLGLVEKMYLVEDANGKWQDAYAGYNTNRLNDAYRILNIL